MEPRLPASSPPWHLPSTRQPPNSACGMSVLLHAFYSAHSLGLEGNTETSFLLAWGRGARESAPGGRRVTTVPIASGPRGQGETGIMPPLTRFVPAREVTIHKRRHRRLRRPPLGSHGDLRRLHRRPGRPEYFLHEGRGRRESFRRAARSVRTGLPARQAPPTDADYWALALTSKRR